MPSSIYVITYHEFNHGKMRPEHPIDKRFLQSANNYIFYLIDRSIPKELSEEKVILEHDLDPTLHRAGGKYLGEWSFLLAEERHAFCQYPLFMISSRFYEKNRWLKADLNHEWDRLFSWLNQYGWGYLPSYDRKIRWYDLSSWQKAIRNKAWEYTLFPFTEKTYELINDLYINSPKKYRYVSDFFCNYIGFRSRSELLDYVRFYRPLIDTFFYEDFSLKKDLSLYARPSGNHRNEKPFTFILELFSHLFFFQKNHKFFGLHYDGYYEIDEAKKRMKRLESFPLSLKTKAKRFLCFLTERLESTHFFGSFKRRLKKHTKLYKFARLLYFFCTRQRGIK